jgi:biotin carboxylase
MKRILLVIPSTTYRTHDFMVAAGKLNAEIIVASDRRKSWANLIPDTTITLNFRKPEIIGEKVLRFARKQPLQAVMGVDDDSAYVAALAAEALSLTHNSTAAVNAARNKYLMRQKLAAAAVQSPDFEVFPVKKNPAVFAKKVDYPCVLKPVFLSGSRGVVRANNPQEFRAAFQEIRELLSGREITAKSYGDEAKQILAETYIPGVEVAVEGILTNGEFKSLAIFDKPDPLEGPHFVETIYVTPSRLPGYVQREVIHAAFRAALALGLKTGPVHAELRINDRGTWVVEIAARSIGGLCSRLLRFDDGKTLEELILRQALSEDIRPVQREKRAAGVMMLPVPKEGILRDITGLEAAKFVPGVEDIVITIPRDQKVAPMHKGGKYLGFIFARGDSPEEAEVSIRKAYQKLKVIVENE